HAQTKDGIDIKYYEDGLYVLTLKAPNISLAESLLREYFTDLFEPALSYIFSLGAPTPKVVANIPTTHPVVVGLVSENPEKFKVNEAFGRVYQSITTPDLSVYKTESHIFIATSKKSPIALNQLIDLQIFFREFKDQLGKYLQIHRTVWEEIAAIKEKKAVSAKDLGKLRATLDSYQFTINLIENRINQMSSYVNTRAGLARSLGLEKHLATLFQYKFEVLTNTLNYIKEIWKMTGDYLENAIKVIVEAQGKGTQSSIQSLRAITTFGVIATMLTFLKNFTSLQAFTWISGLALILAIMAAWLLDFGIRRLADRKLLQLKFTERSEKL
ncbi:MAG: hypothetical protein V1821_01900, partial [bacterium]